MAAAAAAGCMGVSAVSLDSSPDRVKSPLRVDMEWIGTVRPRAAGEIASSNWRLGCEVLDRDFADFGEYRDFVEPLGIKLVRLQGGWAKCEKEKGVYDFAWLDRIVDYLRARGIGCAIETGYGNPIYKGGGTVDLAAGFPTSEEALAGWDGWIRALATHFKGRVDTFMMWNEPDLDPADGSPRKTPAHIAAFNVRTAKIIRSVIPQARLAGLSLAFCKDKPFEECLKAMGEDVRLFESFVYHGYKAAPESSYAEVEKLKAVLAKYHPTARLWQGENGCPSEMAFVFALNGIPWSEYSQAKWDMRRMLGDLGHDVLSSVFTICDFNHKGREINLKGLLRADENKKVIAVKRAYYAVQNVVSVFDDTLVRVRGSGWDKGFGTKDATIATYEYLKNARTPVFAFWSCAEPCAKDDPKVSFVPSAGYVGFRYVRPGESFETRPMAFRYNGGALALADPVWIDLLTGRVYAFPKKNVVVGSGYVRYLDVPVYDSPCLLTERSAVDMVLR
jgi:hypothetical protein